MRPRLASLDHHCLYIKELIIFAFIFNPKLNNFLPIIFHTYTIDNMNNYMFS